MKIPAPKMNQPETTPLPGVEVGEPTTPSAALGMEPRERTAVRPSLVGVGDEVLWYNLTALPFNQLRVLCNEVYKSLNSERPATGAAAQYEALVEEIESRVVVSRKEAPLDKPRTAFRDNTVYSRFEVLQQGVLAGYVRYKMRGGHVVLLETTVVPRFRETDLDVEPALIRRVMLEAHRRRLAVVPLCTVVAGFLAEHPQFLALIPVLPRGRTARGGSLRAGATETVGA